jgi:putative SOS response-associated peptidase YedK
MCGRVRQVLDWSEIRIVLKLDQPPLNLTPRWNGAPRQDLGIVRARSDSDRNDLVLMNWGFLPAWEREPAKARRPINAMTETIASGRGLWRDAFARRRMICPVNGFYEWRANATGPKTPFTIERADRGVMALAGLWDRWRNRETGEALATFAIITCPANATLADIHSRQPVILEAGDHDTWLRGAPEAALGLLRPSPPGIVTIRPLGPRIGNVRNDDPSVLDPVEERLGLCP